ncbi:OmpA family protein [Polycyclovorans algicola]|uniref:OmpA family protein n=1 Tax=Polycyclovorans algicola TaxID=616992 RepID=UPI0006949530|nr:OmpA family protein [Polycyclovorans algicola]
MQIQKRLGITLIALMGAATMASAQSGGNASEIEKWGRPVYVAPMATFTLDDHDRATRNGYGASLAVGTRLFSWLAVEGYGAYTGYTDDSKLTGDASTKALSVGANLLAFPLSGNFKNAYVLAGAGYHDVKDQPSATGGGTFAFQDYDSPIYDLGIGILYGLEMFNTPYALRFETKYRYDDHGDRSLGIDNPSKFEELAISAGVMIPLFYTEPTPPPTPTPSPTVVPPASQADSDNDGVNDDVDQCPDTPPDTKVDSAGCPIPQCVPVGENGDIVLDGCKVGDVVVLQGVKFDFDSARLTENAKSILDRSVEALKKASDINVRIEGHTDNYGENAYNQELSERRATAVVKYLTDAGIDAARLESTGFGEDRPVADNDTDEGREENRRVELRVR